MAYSGILTRVQFTPTVVGQTTAGTTTYVSQSGAYFRMDNLIIVQMVISVSAMTGTGNLFIGGLPYTIVNTNPVPIGTCYITNLTLPAGTTQTSIQGIINTKTGNIIASGTTVASSAVQCANTAFTIAANLNYEWTG